MLGGRDIQSTIILPMSIITLEDIRVATFQIITSLIGTNKVTDMPLRIEWAALNNTQHTKTTKYLIIMLLILIDQITSSRSYKRHRTGTNKGFPMKTSTRGSWDITQFRRKSCNNNRFRLKWRSSLRKRRNLREIRARIGGKKFWRRSKNWKNSSSIWRIRMRICLNRSPYLDLHKFSIKSR